MIKIEYYEIIGFTVDDKKHIYSKTDNLEEARKLHLIAAAAIELAYTAVIINKVIVLKELIDCWED